MKQKIHEGKSKQIYLSDKNDEIIIYYKDDVCAFNGAKKSTFDNKGVLNNNITSIIFDYLTTKEIKNHFIKKINDREQLCKKLTIIPLEVTIRNYVAGSMAKKLNIDEGFKPTNTILEFAYKNDNLSDPFINQHYAVALNISTYEEIELIEKMAFKINELLIDLFDKIGVILVDLKIEFGKDSLGNLYLADEISPDTCRLWDKKTNKRLDKDRFRKDLGDVVDAYEEIFNRLKEMGVK